MQRTASWLLALLVCSLNAWGQVSATDPRIRAALEQLDSQLAAAFKAQNLAGMSAGVVYGRGLIWSKGYGYADWTSKRPADARSVYDIGSISKMFNATALMLLRDAGRLNLDDPIEKYLPEFKFRSRYPDTRPPTFRQVVAHVGGLPRELEVEETEKETRQVSVAAAFKRLPEEGSLVYPPLTEIHYSNLGIYLMGQALARIAGQSYPSFVTERIFRPLDMSMTGWELTAEMKAHKAVGYWPAGPDGVRREGPVWVAGDFGQPAGGIHTNIEDLAKFAVLHLGNGPSGGKQILNGTTIREMQAPVFLNRDWQGGFGVGWGLGRVAGITTVGHGGGHNSTAAYLQLVPELRLALLILINQSADQYSVGRQALEMLIPAFQAVEAEQKAKTRAELLRQLAGYFGSYVYPAANATLELVVWEGKLLLEANVPGEKVPPFELEPEEGGVLRIIRGVGYNVGEVMLATRDPQRGTPQLRFGPIVFDRPK